MFQFNVCVSLKMLFSRKNYKKVVEVLCVVTPSPVTVSVWTPHISRGSVASYTHDTNVKLLWLFAFAVKNIYHLGMKQQSPFFHHFCQGLTFQFGCTLESSRHKQYQRPFTFEGKKRS